MTKKTELIHPYNPNWVTNFESIKTVIQKQLFGLDIKIEHVGSTAVPDLAAKAIIDTDIIYKKEVEFEEIKSRLIKIDYFHNGNQGIEQREVFKRNTPQVESSILDTLAHHLYVCPLDSEELKRHLLFRNYLRQNEPARIKYQAIKYELAEEANQNKKVYTELKEIKVREFILSVIAQATKEKKT
jgi:GrpB-like predicted nucleotidyltransferase (UPF0157 family)